jgi:hypothetical protein
MVAGTISKVEASWDQVFSGNFPETPARQAWREAVAEVAGKAKAALPECNGRVESAVKIVLAGDVELLPDGKAKVASQSNGTTGILWSTVPVSVGTSPKLLSRCANIALPMVFTNGL